MNFSICCRCWCLFSTPLSRHTLKYGVSRPTDESEALDGPSQVHERPRSSRAHAQYFCGSRRLCQGQSRRCAQRHCERSQNRRTRRVSQSRLVAALCLSTTHQPRKGTSDQRHDLAAGATVIRQGQQGRYLYVIQQGTVRFLVDGKDVGQGGAGTIFGELSLLYDCPTAASVICDNSTDNNCQFWRVSQHTFRRLKAVHVLSNDQETRATIRSIAFLRDLPDEYIYKLADSLLQRTFAKGEVLASKGQEGLTLFIIKKGNVQGTDISIGSTSYANVRLGPGEYFGERAIVTGEPLAGNATALTNGVAWILTKERFQQTVGRLNLKALVLKSLDKKFLVRQATTANDQHALSFSLEGLTLCSLFSLSLYRVPFPFLPTRTLIPLN